MTSGMPDVRSATCAGGSVGPVLPSGAFCTEAGRGGAGTTAVMPSGSSSFLAIAAWAASRIRSAAPPGRGLKPLPPVAAAAAAAAFQKAPAISPLDFLPLTVGSGSEGVSSFTGSGGGGGSSGLCTGEGSRGIGVVGMDGGAAPGIGDTAAGGVSSGLAGNAPGASIPVRSFGTTVGARSSIPVRSPVTVLSESVRRVEGFRGDIRSLLRGGGMIGSLRMFGLTSGAGTRSLSACCVGLRGSMGGRRRSGGFSSGICSGCGGGVTRGVP